MNQAEDKIPLVDKEYLLEKFPGKGGWTYIALPEIAPDKKMPFGWVIVNGYIDTYELIKYKLLPMGNGRLFLPVRAVIRTKIKKQAGDHVHVKLFTDNLPLKIPGELISCFENEPEEVYKNFNNLTEGEQKSYIDWIYSAKSEETKAERIIKMLDKVIKKGKT